MGGDSEFFVPLGDPRWKAAMDAAKGKNSDGEDEGGGDESAPDDVEGVHEEMTKALSEWDDTIAAWDRQQHGTRGGPGCAGVSLLVLLAIMIVSALIGQVIT